MELEDEDGRTDVLKVVVKLEIGEEKIDVFVEESFLEDIVEVASLKRFELDDKDGGGEAGEDEDEDSTDKDVDVVVGEAITDNVILELKMGVLVLVLELAVVVSKAIIPTAVELEVEDVVAVMSPVVVDVSVIMIEVSVVVVEVVDVADVVLEMVLEMVVIVVVVTPHIGSA